VPASAARVSPLDAGDRLQHALTAGTLRSVRLRLHQFTGCATKAVSDRSGGTLSRQPKHLLEAFEHRR
jgi:hypothetical protein